jgi:hypothetical protein
MESVVKKSTKTHTRAHFMIARSTRILFLLSKHIHRAHLPFHYYQLGSRAVSDISPQRNSTFMACSLG